MINDDFIRRSEAIANLRKQPQLTKSVVHRVLLQTKSVDAVIRPVVEQIQWERDCAIEQLEEHGIPFGGIAPDVVKVVRCKDCKFSEKDEIHQISVKCNRFRTGIYVMRMWPNDFCSYGERREENAAD